MTSKTINVAKDFARTPGARYRTDGPYSGQEFRESVLLPTLNGCSGPIVIELDGTRGFATSFLEEAFGGLARELSAQVCIDRLQFVSEEDPVLIDEIWGYIREAKG